MTYYAIPIDDYYLMIKETSDDEVIMAVESKAKDKHPNLPTFHAPWEEDAEKLAEIANPEILYDRHIWANGYNARKAMYEFTHEDMKKAIEFGRKFPMARFYGDGIDEFIQSLKKQKVYEIELETEGITSPPMNEQQELLGVSKSYLQPKIINNKVNILSYREVK